MRLRLIEMEKEMSLKVREREAKRLAMAERNSQRQRVFQVKVIKNLSRQLQEIISAK